MRVVLAAFADDVSFNRIVSRPRIKDANTITTVASNEVQLNGVCDYGAERSGYAGGRALEPDSIPIVRENRNILDIKERKGKLESEYQENLRIYKPAFPKMQALKNAAKGSDVSALRSAMDDFNESLQKVGQHIYGGAQADVTTMNYDLTAKYNWWGNPVGPAPGRTLAVNGTITSSPALTAAPPAVC